VAFHRSIAAAVRAASGSAEDALGTIRITAPELFGVEVLPPILTDFRNQHPGIVIELAPTKRSEVCCAGRQTLRCAWFARRRRRRVGEVHFALCAHSAYLDRHGVPESIDALSRHSLIGYNKGMVFIRALRDAASAVAVGAPARPGEDACVSVRIQMKP
jgi:DNA-binding transcriptional LysR family regulator